MAISYIKHDEEFFGIAKLTNGEELLAKMLVFEDSETQDGSGDDLLFVSDPAKVHATDMVKDGQRASLVGLKKWMVFSDEEFFIIPEGHILSIAPMSAETVTMYKLFVRAEFKGENVDPSQMKHKEIQVNQNMGLVGKVEEARRNLENLFKEE